MTCFVKIWDYCVCVCVYTYKSSHIWREIKETVTCNYGLVCEILCGVNTLFDKLLLYTPEIINSAYLARERKPHSSKPAFFQGKPLSTHNGHHIVMTWVKEPFLMITDSLLPGKDGYQGPVLNELLIGQSTNIDKLLGSRCCY